MEPPPLTVSKRKDPLLDGILFKYSERPLNSRNALSGPRPIETGASSGHQGGAPHVPTALWTSAAEAAAVNRSVEAQYIKRSWEALIGASPLPQAVRCISSPAARTLHLTSGFGSPAAPLPFLRDLYTVPAAAPPGTANRLQSTVRFGSPAQGGTLTEQNAAQKAHDTVAPAAGAGAGTRAHKDAGWLWQPQSAGPQHRVTPGGRGGSEGGAGRLAQAALQHPLRPVQQQQQEEEGYRDKGAPFGSAATALAQAAPAPPPLPAAIPTHAAPASARAQASPSAGAGHAAHHAGSEVLLPGAGAAAPAAGPPFSAPGRGQAGIEASGPVVSLAPAVTSSPTQTPSAVRTQIELGQEACSMDVANAQVGWLVRDLCSPVPPEADALHPSPPNPPSVSPQDAAGTGPLDPGGSSPPAELGEGGSHHADLDLTEGASGGVRGHCGRSQGVSAGGTDGRGTDQGRQQQPPSHPHFPPSLPNARKGGQGLAGGRKQDERQRVVPQAEGGATPRDGHPADVAQPSDAADGGLSTSAQSPPCSSGKPATSRGKSVGSGARPAASRGTRKRPKADKGDATSKRRTMLTRGEAAHLQPILRCIGDMEGVQVTRSGRPRIKPLPYWTNTRLVMDSRKDIVGIQQKEDLLGLSGHHRATQIKPEAAGGKVPKTAAGKAALATAKAAPSGMPKQPKSGAKHTAGTAVAGNLPEGGGAAAAAPPAKGRVKQQDKQHESGTSAQLAQSAKTAARLAQMRARDASEELQGAPQEPRQGGVIGTPRPDAVPPSRSCDPSSAAEGGMQPLATMAVTAGARAAEVVVHKKAAGQGAPGGRKAHHTGQTAAPPGAAGGRSTPASQPGGDAGRLPIVEGVPEEVLRSMAALPSGQRRKCLRCQHCLHPASKLVCLSLQAIRELEKDTAGGAASAAGVAQRKGQGPSKQEAARGDTKKKAAKTPRAPAGAAAEPATQPVVEEQRAGRPLPQQEGQQPEVGAERPAAAAAPAGGKKRPAEAEAQRPSASKKARAQRSGQSPVAQQRLQTEEADAAHPRHSGAAAAAQVGAGAARGSPSGMASKGIAGGEEPADEQGWTTSQVAALQRAWLQIDPTAANFWQQVAKQVPGKTATDCYNRHMAKHPTPPHPSRKPAPKKYLAAAKDGAKLPDLKPGASKQVVKHAARQYARQLQWQERATRAQGVAGEEGLGEEMMEEMQAAERKDRYIDQILRKRQGRPLGAAPRTRRPPAAAPPLHQRAPTGPAPAGSAPLHTQGRLGDELCEWRLQVGGGARLGPAAGAAHEVRAALADMGQPPSDDEDSQGGSDYYWSDVEG